MRASLLGRLLLIGVLLPSLSTLAAVPGWFGGSALHGVQADSGAFAQVSAGAYHTCAVRTDGALVCWGRGDYGQSTPPLGTFSQVSAGGYFTCGVRTDGTLACWAYDYYGQSTPPVGAFTQVSAGFNHTCAVRTDGALACWGWNDYGQSTPPRVEPIPTPPHPLGVGGAVVLPPGAIATESSVPAKSSGWPGGAYTMLVGTVVAIGIGGWYARRHWLH